MSNEEARKLFMQKYNAVNKRIKNGERYYVIPGVTNTYNGKKRVPIDVDIAPIVKLLCKKGYITKFCCSGHHDGKKMLPMGNIHGYIYFQVAPSFKSLPVGVHPCSEYSTTTIRWVSRTLKQYKLNIKRLTKWVEGLP